MQRKIATKVEKRIESMTSGYAVYYIDNYGDKYVPVDSIRKQATDCGCTYSVDENGYLMVNLGE